MLYQIHVVWFLGVSIYSNAYMYWEGNTETNNVQKKVLSHGICMMQWFHHRIVYH